MVMIHRNLCLTLGLCLYLGLAAPATAQLVPRSGNSILGGGDRPRPLPMDEAFPYFVSIVDSQTLNVTWEIAPDHYLYRHQFNFSLQSPDGELQEVEFQLPDGVAKTDQFFGEIEAYYQQVTARLSVNTPLPAGTSLNIEYQGCAEWGFCYPPQSSSHKLSP